MPRNKAKCLINFDPKITYFKPRGVPLCSLEVMILSGEEIEALRLKGIEELDQISCAKKMNISQSTFHRILQSAIKKVTKALINGMAIEIINE